MKKLFFLCLLFSRLILASDPGTSIKYTSFKESGEVATPEQVKVLCSLFLFETTLVRRNSSLVYDDAQFLQFYLRRKKLERPDRSYEVLLSGDYRISNAIDTILVHANESGLSQYSVTAIFKNFKDRPLKLIYADYKKDSSYNAALGEQIVGGDNLIFVMERGSNQVNSDGYQRTGIVPFKAKSTKKASDCCCQCQ